MRVQAPTCAALAAALLASALVACTATQLREHTRESYRGPAGPSPVVSRIFAADPVRVYDELLDWMLLRSVEIEHADPLSGRIVADLRFGSDEAQEASVGMGSVRTVITRSRRRYRSYWPFEAGCDECIIRRGNLISAETELVSDRLLPLSARDYEIGALVRAVVAGLPDGARVDLEVDFKVRPQSPAGIAPISTGYLEEAVFQALEQALHDE